MHKIQFHSSFKVNCIKDNWLDFLTDANLRNILLNLEDFLKALQWFLRVTNLQTVYLCIEITVYVAFELLYFKYKHKKIFGEDHYRAIYLKIKITCYRIAPN